MLPSCFVCKVLYNDFFSILLSKVQPITVPTNFLKTLVDFEDISSPLPIEFNDPTGEGGRIEIKPLFFRRG